MVEWKVTPIIDRLNADGPAPQPLGPLTQLPVQKGDTLFVTAPGRYQQATSNHTFSLLSFIASLLQPAPAGTPPGADGARRGGLPLLQVGLSSASLLALNQLPGGVPKAYLRVLSFNQDSVLVDQRTVQLTAAALGNYETLSTGQLIVQQDGYVSVYVGNESATDVYFDDVTIEHRQGLQIQENHYDPFGLDLAGVNSAAPGLKPLNQYKFNGKEFQTDLGLNWNHQDWRFFDTQLGRWHVVDPEIENAQESWTPYSFGFDNAVRFADADGRYPGGGDGFVSQAVDFFNGAANAIASNASTLGPVSGIHRTTDRTGAFAEGQKAGDMISVLQGASEFLGGSATALVGAAGGAVTSFTGVGALAGAGAVVVGTGVAGHGAVTGQNGWNNLFDKGNGRVNASADNTPSRNGAYRQAKRDADVPMSQHPERRPKVAMTDPEYLGGRPVLDKKGMPIQTREYGHTARSGKRIVIQDHGAGHALGGEGPHLNVRPNGSAKELRNGTVEGTQAHYPFKK